jgi:hypothetical protein
MIRMRNGHQQQLRQVCLVRRVHAQAAAHLLQLLVLAGSRGGG